MTKRHMIFTVAGVVVVSLACIACVVIRRHRQANAQRRAAAEYARQFAQRLNGPGSEVAEVLRREGHFGIKLDRTMENM